MAVQSVNCSVLFPSFGQYLPSVPHRFMERDIDQHMNNCFSRSTQESVIIGEDGKDKKIRRKFNKGNCSLTHDSYLDYGIFSVKRSSLCLVRFKWNVLLRNCWNLDKLLLYNTTENNCFVWMTQWNIETYSG